MKPWFNTALILMLTLIWVVIGLGLHERLQNLEHETFYHIQQQHQQKGNNQ